MDATMYILLAAPETTPMSTGKAAAQAAHAAVEAYRLTDPESNLHHHWYVGGHYKKIVLQTHDLSVAKTYLDARGIKTVLIIDEGRTEFNGELTPTAIGCALVNKDNPHIQETFSVFPLYKERPHYVVLEAKRPTTPNERKYVRELAEQGRFEEVRGFIGMLDERPSKRPLRCKFSLHKEFHTREGMEKFEWCLACGATWEIGYDFMEVTRKRRRDLSYGKPK